ncbi:MAG: cytochrome-c oxidase, cbb3-type subunit III [Pseudomonadota bacterium]
MSQGMSWFVIIGTLLSIIATFWLIVWAGRQGPQAEEGAENTGHVWDGLVERNEPLPRWWLGLFVLTLVFGVGYLVWYPGMGAFAGTSGWSQAAQYDEEVQAAEARYGAIFAAFRDMPATEIVHDEDALRIGRSLFSNYCTQCHGSLGYGAASFPNLADSDWLYGGDLASINTSILNGRKGLMPALGAVFADDAALSGMVEYVRNLSISQDTSAPAHGQYIALCSACHGATGDGMTALGAPRLNDDVWLYGSSPETIRETIVNGRQGVMPAHDKFLGEDRVRLIAAYVYSLSNADAADGDD